MPFSGNIMWAYAHQHIGEVNATFSHNGVQHCHGYPHTGTDKHMTPGNEEGYIVAFSLCIDPKKGNFIHAEKGDNLTLTAFYSIDPQDNRSFPIPGGGHKGIMNLFYMFIAVDEPEDIY